MDYNIAMKWVKALRSGDYKQAQKFLKVDNAYCCLGVLCEVVGFGFKRAELQEVKAKGVVYQLVCQDAGDETGVIAGEAQEKATIGSRSGSLPFHYIDVEGTWRMETIELTEANDAGLTFAQIADIIEWAWQDL